MSAAHTPGPWEAIVDKTGEVTVYEATTRANTDICTMGGNVNDGANARLLAAATDLLAALEACIDRGSLDGDPWARVKVLDAIAKATGEAQ